MRQNKGLSAQNLSFGLYFLSFPCLLSANTIENQETFSLTGLIIVSLGMLLCLSIVFLLCVQKLINERNQLTKRVSLLESKNEDLLERLHQYFERETDFITINDDLEKRITARTETVNKVNHELTRTLEQLHHQNSRLDCLSSALEHTKSRLLIIDKHYHVAYASKALLSFLGKTMSNLKNQPLARLEDSICLPEMQSELKLNQEGLIETKLKCRDAQGIQHLISASIALNWSDNKDINFYVVILDESSQSKPSALETQMTGIKKGVISFSDKPL